MKVCAVQLNTVWEDKKATMVYCSEAVMCSGDAELVIFPELTLTGFSMEQKIAEENGETVEFFSDLSKKYKKYIAFGYAAKVDGERFNRYCVTNVEGVIVAQYDKIHPFTIGGEVYSAGNSLAKFTFGDMTVGLAVCYDLRFPEMFQKLSEECDCIIVAACWPTSRREHWLALLKARAIECQSYMIGCNCCGEIGGLSYSGDTVIFAPDGKEVCKADGAYMQLVRAEIFRQEVADIRRGFPVKEDRRIELYRSFIL